MKVWELINQCQQTEMKAEEIADSFSECCPNFGLEETVKNCSEQLKRLGVSHCNCVSDCDEEDNQRECIEAFLQLEVTDEN
jgi:hypothetical protein